jgi:cytochrome c biogenesis protein CcdA
VANNLVDRPYPVVVNLAPNPPVAGATSPLSQARLYTTVINSYGCSISSVIGAKGQQALDDVKGNGLLGQMMVGLLLGFVWTPCVGPTLGAATSLAAQGQDLGHIAILMALFGLGAALPLVLLGTISRVSLLKMRGTLAAWGKTARWTLGALFVVMGTIVITGVDRQLETLLLSVSPTWLTALTTSI